MTAPFPTGNPSYLAETQQHRKGGVFTFRLTLHPCDEADLDLLYDHTMRCLARVMVPKTREFLTLGVCIQQP